MHCSGAGVFFLSPGIRKQEDEFRFKIFDTKILKCWLLKNRKCLKLSNFFKMYSKYIHFLTKTNVRKRKCNIYKFLHKTFLDNNGKTSKFLTLKMHIWGKGKTKYVHILTKTYLKTFVRKCFFLKNKNILFFLKTKYMHFCFYFQLCPFLVLLKLRR